MSTRKQELLKAKRSLDKAYVIVFNESRLFHTCRRAVGTPLNTLLSQIEEATNELQRHIDSEVSILSLKKRRMLAAVNGAPIPMNKVEARRFRVMVMNNMHLDFQQARIDACTESTTVLRKIDLIQAFANAAVCESYNGEASR